MKPIFYPLLTLSLMILTACSNDDSELGLLDSDNTHTITLRLESSFQRYEATRATTSEWADGTIIYIQFQTDKGFVDGTATYKANRKEWTLSYNGTPTYGKTSNCKVYYFEKAMDATPSSASLSASTAIYADNQASYSFENNMIVMKAEFKPQLGRIRFHGKAGHTITVHGLKWNEGYVVRNDTFTSQTGVLSLKVEADGYTPYVYATFSDDRRQLTFEDEDYIYHRSFNSAVLALGKSGYIDVPTKEAHKGWEVSDKTLSFTVTGNGKTVTFKMIKVKAGSFQMGSSTGRNNEKPVHVVALTKPYVIGETEVTNALWYAVMGNKPTNQKNDGDTYPVTCVSWVIINQSGGFLDKLNTMLDSQVGGKKFRLPSEAEWEYAARGGHKQSSPYFTYAGSNTLSDVAWYSENSNNTTHPVGQKKPNELGLSDMSGNVYEWCNDWYGENYYSHSPATDPTGPTSGSYRVSRGSSWCYDAANCHITIRGIATPTNSSCNDMGFRLALDAN